jgi:hypothetical protein
VEQPELHVLHGDAHAVPHAGCIVTCCTAHELHGAYPAVQLWHVEHEEHPAGAA